ncbi:sodium/hydrogen exchanger [Dyadobacter endophyticus]|uniref:Sodium/hydrogen exchanger n=1 Tax=Dyadobacter endophyticus TaxID=1749036 RepID=A0ABQ1YBQ8_9BACT|nr:cation:proton antiporter [Dyadobacter endophyticus]GGH20174.1 sodium/hydrogen exchanger [Dyadobacter endophyticus]
MNQVLFSLTALCLLILLLTILLKKFRQPNVIAYIIAGFLIGPHMANLFHSAEDIEPVAEIGILLLMIFLGIEIDIPDSKSLLFKPFIAQGMKVIFTLGLVMLISFLVEWSWLTGAVIFILLIFNSTAVVSEFLHKNGELKTEFGMTILNILLLQDLMLAPILGVLQFAERGTFSWLRVAVSIAVSMLVFIMLRAIRNRDFLQLKIKDIFQGDHELQVFAGCLLCLGFGVLAELSGLSGALGSFIAGIFIGKQDAFQWLENALRPFKVFFVALFFVTIGLRLDLVYVQDHLLLVSLGTLLLLAVNSGLSTLIFKALKYTWADSLYAGALLSQIGEFGILACSLAYKMKVIDHNLFKTGIAITALSLLISTVWTTAVRKFVVKHAQPLRRKTLYRFP